MTTKTQRHKALGFSPLHLVVYALILGLVGYIIVRSQAAPNPPAVYLEPASQTYAANTTFTVALRVNAGTTPVNAVEANLTYPENLLEFVSIAPQTSITSPFDIAPQSSGGSGTVTIGRAVNFPNTVTGDQLAANITFKTKTATGTANIAFGSSTVLLHATTNENILGASSTPGASFIVDASPPVSAVTAPANGAVFAGGSSVTINATATDNTRVSGVGVYIDGSLVQTLTTSPYTYTWNTNGVALGAHTIQVRATDPYGGVGPSSTISVTLADQGKPTVSITAPSAGAKVANVTAITANAADNTGGTGLSKVEFYVDNVLKHTASTAPYKYDWDTKTASEGSHNLTAKAYDKATPENSTVSTPVSVTVENTDKIAPSAPSSLRTSAVGNNDITLAWGASTDNVGVTGYRIQRNGATLTTVGANVLTYKDTGLSASTSYDYTVVALDAANNTSPAATLKASTAAQKPGDVNKDGVVGVADLSLLLQNWRTTNAACDFNKNGTVDIYDLSILLTNYGK